MHYQNPESLRATTSPAPGNLGGYVGRVCVYDRGAYIYATISEVVRPERFDALLDARAMVREAQETGHVPGNIIRPYARLDAALDRLQAAFDSGGAQ